MNTANKVAPQIEIEVPGINYTFIQEAWVEEILPWCEANLSHDFTSIKSGRILVTSGTDAAKFIEKWKGKKVFTSGANCDK